MVVESIINSMWIEKYRPTTLDDIVLNEDTKKIIEKFVAEGEFPHLFLCSEPGQGKTSLAKILAKNVFKCDTLYINASDENNVETVRNKITNFATTASLDGTFKCVILDEADGFANIQSQKILRGLMESTSDTCRFILTANFRHKIFKPLQSRMLELDITPDKNGIIKRLVQILINENVMASKSELEKLKDMVESYYPDIRSMIKVLQSSVDENNKLSLKQFTVENVFLNNLLTKVNGGNVIEVRKFYLDNEVYFNGDYTNLLNEFYKFVIDNDEISSKVRTNWTIDLAEHIYRTQFVVDSEINCAACFAKMCNSLK